MTRQVDTVRITKLIGSMRESIRLLREVAGLSREKFLADMHLQGSAKYSFIAAIEAAIDIANHIISRKSLRVAEDYADTFRVLSGAGLIDADFALELEKMARFRNRLVHLYWEVDPEELFRILQSKLGDFDTYIDSIGKCISERRNSATQ